MTHRPSWEAIQRALDLSAGNQGQSGESLRVRGWTALCSQQTPKNIYWYGLICSSHRSRVLPGKTQLVAVILMMRWKPRDGALGRQEWESGTASRRSGPGEETCERRASQWGQLMEHKHWGWRQSLAATSFPK